MAPFDMFLIYVMHIMVIEYIKVQVCLLRSVVLRLKVSPLYSWKYETCFVLCSCLHLNRNQCPCERGVPITSLAVFFLCPLCNDSSTSRRSSKCWREWTLIIDSWQLWHESKTFFFGLKRNTYDLAFRTLDRMVSVSTHFTQLTSVLQSKGRYL